jgi:cytochrome c oxidase subunit 2
MKETFNWGLPIDVSTHGADVDRLIAIIHVTMIVLFVGWFLFLLYTLVRFRRRPGVPADSWERHFRLPTILEAVIAVFELVLLAAVSSPIWARVRIHVPSETDAMPVRVIAQQFAWNVHYPGKDGRFGRTDLKLMESTNPVGIDLKDAAAKDDVITTNQLHVPVGKPVLVRLSSKDVIHSFAVPVMRVKQDAIPGQEIRVWFEAKKTGQFEIACAQLCGLGHYRMRGFFTVDTPEEFEKWMAEQAPAVEPEAAAASPVAEAALPAPAAPLAAANPAVH